MIAAPAQVPAPPAPRTVHFVSDRSTLTGTLHLPAGAPRAAVVLHGATAVPQSYYQAFAAWVAAEEGLACLTYDYRDFGASAQGPLAASRATMADWGVRDQAAAQAALERQVPGVPIWVVGHSLGGLMLPFHPHSDRVERAIVVASGPVHWRDHRWDYRLLVMALWYVLGPVATTLLGYTPGKALGFGADLPRGVFWQWRRWCTGHWFEGMGRGGLPMPDWYRVRARMKFVAVSDDQAMPPRVVWTLMQNYPAAAKRQLTLRPEDHGLSRIGHIGAFARANAACWPALLKDEAPAPASRAVRGLGNSLGGGSL